MTHYGFAGKTLYVDLSRRRIEIRRTHEIDSGFLGGRGFNQSILLDGQKEMISPFDQNNLLVFGAGRLVGTGAPSAVRMNVDSKNVFTGGIGSANMGGRFAKELKSAGFDHVVICGKSEDPVYLWIHHDQVEIRDAKPLWGRLICETSRYLKESLGDERIQFVGIGPAGEHSVWTSAIIEGNSRAAARCGLGAIMGDKKLKALVVRGTRKRSIPAAHPERFSALVKEFSRKLSSLPAVKRKKRFGTVAAIPTLQSIAAMPVRNFADEYLSPEELSPYLPERFEELSLGPIHSCHPCVIQCHHRYKGSLSMETPWDKLEANTIWDFGPRLGLTDPEDLLTCHSLCTHYGLDIDSTASVICWAIDCFEKELLKPSDTDGLILRSP